MSVKKVTKIKADDPKDKKDLIGPSIIEKSGVISYLAMLKKNGINPTAIINRKTNTWYNINETNISKKDN